MTLIDREPAYVWKPMLHTIAAGTSDVSQQETHYIAQARDRRFLFEPGELKGLNREARKVHLGPLRISGRQILPERDIPYDTLILAIGSQANDFGTPGVREHCFMIHSRSQALDFNREVQARMLESFAARITLRIAIVGGGATGTELAAELIQLTEIAGHYGAAGLSGQVKVTLLEERPAVARRLSRSGRRRRSRASREARHYRSHWRAGRRRRTRWLSPSRWNSDRCRLEDLGSRREGFGGMCFTRWSWR